MGNQTFGLEKKQEMCETEVERESECLGGWAGGLGVFAYKDMTAHSLKCYFLFGRCQCVFLLHYEASASPPLTFSIIF